MRSINALDIERYLEDDDGYDPLLPEPPPPLPERWRDLIARVDTFKLFTRLGKDARPIMIGRYLIEDVLGHGGMGMVVRGWDPELGRCVAIKLCLSADEVAEEVLRREAMTLARLRHPNIIAVHDMGRFEGSLYMVMDLVEGDDGRRWLERWVSVDEVRRVFSAATRGLDAAHRAGVLHGDFKPSNVLVGVDGEVLVADFGVAEVLRLEDEEQGEGEIEADIQETKSRPRGGTLEYMAPERLRGHRGDERADQFSLCVSMWFALHGVRPFAGKSAGELLMAIESGFIQTGDELAEGALPGSLERAVLRGLRANPRARHPSMGALLEAISDTKPGGGESRWRGRWVHAAWMAGVMTLVFVVVLGLLWRASERPRVGTVVGEVEVVMPAESAVDVALGLIREGQHQQGIVVWESERGRREARGEPFAEEGLRVGAALLKRGEDVLAVKPKVAGKLATAALDLAEPISDELWRRGMSMTAFDAMTARADLLQTKAGLAAKKG